MLAVIRCLLGGPQLLHRQHTLPDPVPTLGEHEPVVLVFLDVPAVADAEDEPPAGDHVERRHLLGRPDRITLGQQADAGTDLERGGRGRHSRKRDELIVGPPVVVR